MRKGAYWMRVGGWTVAITAVGLILLGIGLAVFYPLRYEGMITRLSKAQGLDPYLVFGVIRAESRFRPEVVSRAGAIGLMQITPQTGEWIAGKLGASGFTPDDLYQPETNVRFGTWYLRYLLDRFGGDLDSALRAYNAGPGTVDRWAAGDGEVYPETAAYLEAVRYAVRAYRVLYGSLLGPIFRALSG